ncbi:MAG: CehA/McbA family metallohydrolase [Alphaproteobacteria bacterium]|nr:CehA/McbA family metallohydrolase [Alphaproteobacteria bacterium]
MPVPTPILLQVLVASATAGDVAPLDLSGTVPVDGPDHVLVPFEVPAGTAEVQVHHDDGSDAVILDWGLTDPDGFRGWGGGNPEDAIVGQDAASRSYLTGPIPAGTWNVVVGKAKLDDAPASYALQVFLREAPTLAPQPDRGPYTPAAPLKEGPAWYAGDLHVHTEQSGDARPTMDDAATYARGRGLDFVEFSEHNTTSQLQYLTAVQARHPDVLLLPGIEVTTYDGHANAIGATAWVDHRVGLDGLIGQDLADAVHDQDALFSVNHPTLELGDACIGCAWHQDVSPDSLDAYEVITGSIDNVASVAHPSALAAWDALCAQGLHVAAVGGSDDHDGGQGSGLTYNPIGSPTTLVHADRLDVAAILAGIRAGRTVVKLGGPDDPMVVLDATDPLDGDTVIATATTVRATVTDGVGTTVRLFVDGAEVAQADVTEEGQVLSLDVTAPAQGERRVRAEVWRSGTRRTLTSHVWVRAPDPTTDAPPTQGCDCAVARGPGGGAAWVLWIACAVPMLRRRRELTASSAHISRN